LFSLILYAKISPIVAKEKETALGNKYLVIDSHMHFLPEEAISKAKSLNSLDFDTFIKGDMGGSPHTKIQSITGILRIMEESGMDMAVLNQSSWSLQGLEVCKALNDGYARIKREYPGKFILCGQVPLGKIPGAVNEVERCVKELGLHGMSILTSAPDIALDMPELWPIYDKIAQLDVPIVVHPSIRAPIWGGGKKYNLSRTISREYDIAKSCVEVMYGVLKDFPELKFLFPHYGGGMPALKARLRAWYEGDLLNIPAEIKGSPKTPRELEETGLSRAFDELFGKIYFDMSGSGAGWLPMLKAALLVIPARRTCFGTDYPYDLHSAQDIRQFIDNIKNLEIPDEEKRAMLGENIRQLFKI
jgi:aminocarboxymuconate-semialdehyde decarboxylase